MKQEDCIYCGFTVLSGARVCAHCNAQRESFRDKSFFGRLIGAFKVGFVFLIVGFVVGAIGADGDEFNPAASIVFLFFGVLWGLFRGDKSTRWWR